MDMDCFVIIGDLNRSRELENRAAIQRTLKAAIAGFNTRIGARALPPARLTAGDEVQGIFEDPRLALDMVLTFSDAVAPTQFSWGLGFGEVSTDIAEDVALMDGPCFHRAREALELCRKKGTWFEAEGIEPFTCTALVAIMNLMGAIREDWTEKQAEYARQARDHSQIEVARAMGKSPSTISRALRATKFERVMEAEQAARLLLDNVRND